ncbi:hypothetical protein [Actinacidiphila sp. ITFR-21]|uniref:hypothetical protein n=1 Tax=Actinacidiphila sp. ITFR-21 TaxID=3075199 RepID=UPI002889282A|nr:hypothetical protein [Streptomyces sp. ITFR-21]WNI17609.1 hypothetical protein RLT57_20180 [Streptomyces sp. ITFR-21]WNI17749.1 hypothetical protein RLT57_20895 [Streptomyces sp. ITFR-21]
MPAVYPMSVKSWTPKVDQVDTIWAAHVNDLQNELAAVERTVGANPHTWVGWSPSTIQPRIWPPPPGSMTLKTPAPVANFGAAKTFTDVSDRIKTIQQQTTWLTLMTQLLVGQSGTKPSKPAAAVIRAPGMHVPTGEESWTPFKWGAADYDPNKMYHGGSTIACPVSGFWEVTVNVWADSTTQHANDFHFVHVRLMRGSEEVAGQDSIVETRTWIRHRINMAWQGRWNAGTTMQVQISQHGLVSASVSANATVSFSFVRDLT